MPKLTKDFVDDIRVNPGLDGDATERTYWDDDLTGFGLRVRKPVVAEDGTSKRPAMTWIVMYRTLQGRQRKLTIGAANRLAPKKARDEAEIKLAEVTMGNDPATMKQETRQFLTVTELSEIYLGEAGRAKKPDKKESSWAADRILFNCHIIPLLGDKVANLLTADELETFQKDVKEGKTAHDKKTERGRSIVKGGKTIASRSLAVVGAMLQFGVDKGLVKVNAAKGVKLYKTDGRERFLSERELVCLADALAIMESEGLNANAVAAIRMLLLTGCRKEEILGLKWSQVSIERKCLELPDSKTGKKTVPLAPAAIKILEDLPRDEWSDWVFPARPKRGKDGKIERSHFVGLQKIWKDIRERATVMAAEMDPESPTGQLVARLKKGDCLPNFAQCVAAAKEEGWSFPVGISNVRLHDFRHSFASFAVRYGTPLFVVGKTLGQKQARSTEKYAHLSNDPIRQAANRTAGRIAKIMGRTGAKVVPIGGAK